MSKNVMQFGTAEGRPADVLVISPLHPFPPRCGSAVRISQYIRYLTDRGIGVDLAVLSEFASRTRDEEAARAAMAYCRRVLVVRHPIVASRLGRLAYRAWGRTIQFRLGDWLHCPPQLSWGIRRWASGQRYRAAIISGVHLSRLTSLFGPPTLRILEAQDVWYDRYQSYAALGRGAELGNFADPVREARLASRFDLVMAINPRDAGLFQSLGVKRPVMVVPFVADTELLGASAVENAAAPPESRQDPVRPPRILFVGTENSSNLDGLRFFRTRVFPAIRRRVPSCRLRVVGLAAHHLDPGPGVELVGWVESLATEYREATVVAVPLRMGSGLKTKVVEALAHGKALLTTPVGAQGVDMTDGLHAVISEDPEVLAREGVRILTDDAVRHSFEENARDLAQRLFDPDVAFQPLLEALRLNRKVQRSLRDTEKGDRPRFSCSGSLL